MAFLLEKIATVENDVQDRIDDNWGNVISEIILEKNFTADAFKGLEEFSHAEIIFGFHLLEGEVIETSKRHPRNFTHLPLIGIFSQRASRRPNLLGSTIVKIIGVKDEKLTVSGLDACDGSPVYDIKPVMREFIPDKNEIRQPEWTKEIMKNYF